MKKTIIDENIELLNSLGPLTGDAARLAHRLSQTTDRLKIAEICIHELHPKGGKQITIQMLEGLTEN